MNSNNAILDAWMMVERLSEGKPPAQLQTLSFFASDFYTSLSKALQNNKKGKQAKGVLFYFGIFPFADVAKLLDTQPLKNAPAPYTERILGNRFSFSLGFDQTLRLVPDCTFVTESYFIKQQRTLANHDAFSSFVETLTDDLHALFEEHEGTPYQDTFDKGIQTILKKYGFTTENVKLKLVDHIEDEQTSLHSFFIKDLELAKTVHTHNLDAYLLGKSPQTNRINLDSKRTSPKFHPKALADILQPKYYPNGRFLGKFAHSLSLMQQVAVNVMTGYENKETFMLSVNGPPGTGKTTLLTDVFASLMVEQAKAMATLSNGKPLKGNTSTVYYVKDGKSSCIGIVPPALSDLGIVVASSNNGAVQNIVSELPLVSKVKEPSLQEAILQADYFTRIANKVNDKNSSKSDAPTLWGLVSMEGGRKNNVAKLMDVLKDVYEELESGVFVPDASVYPEFLLQYQAVEQAKKRMQTFCDLRAKLQQVEAHFYENIDSLPPNEIQAHKEALQHEIDHMKANKPAFWELTKQKNYRASLQKLQSDLDTLVQKEQSISLWLKQIDTLRAELVPFGAVRPLDFSLSYDDLQLFNPWFDADFRAMQSNLFILSLKVRKQFLYENRKHINASYNAWTHLGATLAKQNDALLHAFHWMHLLVPVIGSTFASFASMFQHFGANSLGYLFIDEAGQALPQASVGAILRNPKVIVVGDPAQIKPVLTLDDTVLQMIQQRYGVDARVLSEDASTQTLADAISPYGFYTDSDCENWIGIPLWVHRRCQYPMFTISNHISYQGNMVQGTRPSDGKAKWHDVKGRAKDKYVPEQGQWLKTEIAKRAQLDPSILDPSIKDSIFVITPFRNVSKKLAETLEEIHFTRWDANHNATNIGTVHTFQGKEADIVFLVLGADASSAGAARWAIGNQNPNIMNVATTRAKKEFHIIGDLDFYRSLGSEIMEKTLKAIDEWNHEHL